MTDAGIREFITLGADVGGEDAHAATHEHILLLRSLLSRECKKIYSKTIKEIALVLRIDGSVQSWGKSGVQNVVFSNRGKIVTADIFMPREIWSANDSLRLRDFLLSEVRNAVSLIGDIAQRRGIELSSSDLARDIQSATENFCNNMSMNNRGQATV